MAAQLVSAEKTGRDVLLRAWTARGARVTFPYAQMGVVAWYVLALIWRRARGGGGMRRGYLVAGPCIHVSSVGPFGARVRTKHVTVRIRRDSTARADC
jgi:hypothetical protein